MTDRLITHLRHVDLAVPDYARQLDFFTNTWGLTGEHDDAGMPRVDLGPAASRGAPGRGRSGQRRGRLGTGCGRGRAGGWRLGRGLP